MLPTLLIFLACVLKALSSPSTEASRPGSHPGGSNLPNNFYPPEDVPGPKPLPAWVTAYKTAKSQGLIPSISPSVLSHGDPSYPHYSDHVLSDPNQVCSWTVSKCNSTQDIITAPSGKMGISFDDGPQEPTPRLLSFLRKHHQTATHFLIGSRILDKPKLLLEIFHKNHDHIAVHTWSHPYMTTMTDEQVLGEIGWTMQIIHDLTGIVPAFWRPPYGDIDNRVRAISQHVFGLKTVMWSEDPNDWCLSDDSSPGSDCTKGSGPQNMHQLVHDLNFEIHQGVLGENQFTKNGIISLEHELSRRTVGSFIKTYPLAKSLGWDTRAIPDLFGLAWYQQPLSNSSRSGILPKLDDLNITQPTAPSNTTNSSAICTPASHDPSANCTQASQGNQTKLEIIPHSNFSNSTFIPRRQVRSVASTLTPFPNIKFLTSLNSITLVYLLWRKIS